MDGSSVLHLNRPDLINFVAKSRHQVFSLTHKVVVELVDNIRPQSIHGLINCRFVMQGLGHGPSVSERNGNSKSRVDVAILMKDYLS